MSSAETAKRSPAEIAQLRAEIRRRKILEQGDERMNKFFKESNDERSSLSRAGSVEERNKNLIEEIIKDPKVMEKINSIDKVEPATINCNLLVNGSAKSNSAINQATDNLCNLNNSKDQTIEEPFKPKIDLSYFEEREKKEKLREERLAISRFELLMISLINILTLKKDAILVNLFKILFACLASYLCLNIVTPFLISQSIAYFYSDFLTNRQFSNQFNLKLSYSFFKKNLLDSLNFFFFYTIIQAFLLN